MAITNNDLGVTLRTYSVGRWVVAEDVVYRSTTGRIIRVPAGFITDLASVPWLVDPLLWGIDHRLAGVVHDWLYCSHITSRAEADAIFCELVRLGGADPVRAGIMHAALCAAGWYRWGRRPLGPVSEDFDL